MKLISEAMKDALQAEMTSLATCWKIVRRDGVIMGFTDHDCDLEVADSYYAAKTGFTPTAISTSASLSIDNMDIEGMLDTEAISCEDIMAGLYDFAEIEIFLVNYLHPEQGILPLKRGWFGEVTLKEGRFIAEIQGLTQKFSQNIGELYSSACRAELGDHRCKINLISYTKTGTVQNSDAQNIFTDLLRQEQPGYFAGGKVTFTSGLNNGKSMEIKEFSSGRFVCVLPLPFSIVPGDNYIAVTGCDKRFETCITRFANAVNFRGEPHVPGMNRMLETATTRKL